MKRVVGVPRMLILFVFLLSVVPCRPAFASWEENGTPICTATGDQLGTTIISDGAGGAIITWLDYRDQNHPIIYAQRIDVEGEIHWVADGAATCTDTCKLLSCASCSDGAGGVVITWHDYRPGGVDVDVYSQRLDSNGNVAWAAGGVAVCTALGQQPWPKIVSDGAGGAIIAWEDWRGLEIAVYAQRVGASGNMLWVLNGVPATTTATAGQEDPCVASDGAGGAIVVWMDRRGSDDDIYAQRFDASGNKLWASNGLAIATAVGDQWYPSIISDGAGGAIIAWEDRSSLVTYAQRVDASGNVLWTQDGISISPVPSFSPAMVSDGAGGAIVTWGWSGLYADTIFAQRVGASGTLLWGSRGVAAGSSLFAELPAIVPDGAGGAIISWDDGRNVYPAHDIYVQRINASGARLCADNGVAVCTASGLQRVPKMISDGFGGAIIAWDDSRSGTRDIYASRAGPDCITSLMFASVGAKGVEGYVTLSWQTAVDVPASSFLIKRAESIGGQYSVLDVPVVSEGRLSFSCSDRSVISGRTYWYKIVLTGAAGGEESAPIQVYVEPLPVAYRAYESYPNPFNPLCTIRYDIPSAGRVSLQIFDVSGSLVRTLVNRWREPGVYSEMWDGKADSGTVLPSGVYFYRLEAGSFVATRKIVLLR